MNDPRRSVLAKVLRVVLGVEAVALLLLFVLEVMLATSESPGEFGSADATIEWRYALAFLLGAVLLGWATTLSQLGLVGGALANVANVVVHVDLIANPRGDVVELWWSALNFAVAAAMVVGCLRLVWEMRRWSRERAWSSRDDG